MKQNRKSFISLDTKSKIRNYFFKNVKTDEDLLRLINIINEQQFEKVSPLKLSYIHYHAYKNQAKYKMFRIPKKSGAKREIIAPNKGLKNIQKALNIILQSIYKPHISAHGFINNRSVITNAKKHVNKHYVYNIDLENFFPSIHQARIWKRLQSPPFNMPQKLANLVSALTCYQYEQGQTKQTSGVNKVQNFLPQGASTSPVISNIICERLDKRLIGVAKRFNLTYTRYADDITFSSDHNVYQKNSPFIEELKSVIRDEHFTINSSKTRLQKKETKQVVTGLVVNNKINVPRGYVKKLRMLIHILEKYGVKKAKYIYIDNQKKELISKGFRTFKSKNILHVISGKLEYLRMVKGSDDSTYMTLKKRFNNCFSDKESMFKQAYTVYETEDLNKHNPHKMLMLLSQFETNKLLKSTIEPTIQNEEYIDFIRELRNLWKTLYKDYKDTVHTSLLSKIYVFLFQKNVIENGWGYDRVKTGWSSPELKKWIKKNPNSTPDEFIIQDSNDEFEAIRFADVIVAFQDEIKIAPSRNSLYSIFFNIFNDIEPHKIRPLCSIGDENILKEASFYVDTQQLKLVLNDIAKKCLGLRSELHVRVSEEYIELHICALETLYGIEGERFESDFLIRDLLKDMVSMCDFRIETIRNDKLLALDFLGEDDALDQRTDINGTTFVLRFYTKPLK